MEQAIQITRPADVSAHRSALDRGALSRTLRSLLQTHLDTHPDVYLNVHAQKLHVRGHVRLFCEFVSFLPPSGQVLDWGCRHAPDSCLLRTVAGDRLRLHGCDFVDPRQYAVFHEYAGLEYRRLTEPVATPYDDGSFDGVIASGVLEHVAMDYESLKELHRLLRPGGILVITYLPNRLSVREWFRRSILKRDFHRRLYGLGEARQLLKRAGFYPLLTRRPCRNSLLLPFRLFGSTLMLVAQKVESM